MWVSVKRFMVNALEAVARVDASKFFHSVSESQIKFPLIKLNCRISSVNRELPMVQDGRRAERIHYNSKCSSRLRIRMPAVDDVAYVDRFCGQPIVDGICESPTQWTWNFLEIKSFTLSSHSYESLNVRTKRRKQFLLPTARKIIYSRFWLLSTILFQSRLKSMPSGN